MPERPDATGAWTFLRVPFDVQEVFGSRARVAVKGSVNGVAVRGSLMPQGDGAHILVVNKSVRDRATKKRFMDEVDGVSFQVAR